MSNEPVGGVGSVVKNYQTHFQRDKIKIDFIIFDPQEDTPFNRTVRENGAAVYTFPLLTLKNVVKIIVLLQKFYKMHQGEYHIVHVHSPNIAWMCFLNAKRYGIKYRIVHSHSTSYSDEKLKSLRNRIVCIPIKRIADIYMACSKAAGAFLFGKKSLDKVIIVKNAIDCSKFQFNDEIRKRVREELKINDAITVGHVGRIDYPKNHNFIIDIFEQIIKRHRNSILMLVGDGPLKECIMETVKRKGIADNVLFLGSRDDVYALLQAMDVFLMPSLFEGLPVVGIEAQASGLPCVMSAAVTEEVNVGLTSYMSLSDSAEKWAESVLKRYGSSNRIQGAQLVSEAGYDIAVEAKKLEDLYLGLN